MRSWVFRNRKRLESIYRSRRAGSWQSRPAGTSDPLFTDPHGSEADDPERPRLGIYILYPRRSRILPAA